MVPSTHSVSRPRPRYGFTLVELLVVISIIALLIGLLLPALTAAKYASRKVVSLANMHQTSLAIFAYAEDNKTYVPNSPRQDQGCDFWGNFYIIVYPTNLVYNTIGSTIHPYITSSNIFMAPNHWDHLVNVYLPASNAGSGLFGWAYGWYGNPGATGYGFTSYCYLPWIGFLPYPTGPTIRLGDDVPGTSVHFNNLTILDEVVAGNAFIGPGYWDNTPDAQYKSVNFVNGAADGGNLLFGDGSGNYAPMTAFNGGLPRQYQVGGYNWACVDIIYRY